MSCLSENELLFYVEGVGDAARRAEVEAHLALCDDCRALLQATLSDSNQDLEGSMARTLVRHAPVGDARPARSLAGVVLNETYTIERLIGEGGMGAVYEASHRHLARRFAIKVIAAETGDDQQLRARIKREALITSRLRHPNIVEVTDFGYTAAGEPFLVMELLGGESLALDLARRGALTDLRRAGQIADQMLSALDAAHREGIVHRDLKPANIFLCHQASAQDPPRVKVMDFGLSKAFTPSAAASVTGSLREDDPITQMAAVLGSPQYMSPEQASGQSASADQRSDVFSLGAVLFRMLAGHAPFVGDNVHEVIAAVRWHPPAETPAWRALPTPVRDVVLRALEKRPEQRQTSAGELARDLAAALARAPAPPAVALLPPTRRWWRRPPTLALGIGGLLLLLLLAVGWSLHRGRGDGREPTPRVTRVSSPLDAASAVDAVDATTTTAAPDASDGAGERAAPPARAPKDGGMLSALDAAAIARRRSPPERRVARRRRGRRPGRHGKPRATGRLGVQTRASDGHPLWADVYLDGRPVGRTALTLDRVTAGRHRIEVRRTGYQPAQRTVTVRPGALTRVRFRLQAR